MTIILETYFHFLKITICVFTSHAQAANLLASWHSLPLAYFVPLMRRRVYAYTTALKQTPSTTDTRISQTIYENTEKIVTYKLATAMTLHYR